MIMCCLSKSPSGTCRLGHVFWRASEFPPSVSKNPCCLPRWILPIVQVDFSDSRGDSVNYQVLILPPPKIVDMQDGKPQKILLLFLPRILVCMVAAELCAENLPDCVGRFMSFVREPFVDVFWPWVCYLSARTRLGVCVLWCLCSGIIDCRTIRWCCDMLAIQISEGVPLWFALNVICTPIWYLGVLSMKYIMCYCMCISEWLWLVSGKRFWCHLVMQLWSTILALQVCLLLFTKFSTYDSQSYLSAWFWGSLLSIQEDHLPYLPLPMEQLMEFSLLTRDMIFPALIKLTMSTMHYLPVTTKLRIQGSTSGASITAWPQLLVGCLWRPCGIS